MWLQAPYGGGGYPKFFYITLGYDSLENFMKTNFSMMQHHKYSYSELMEMIPWERHVYLALLNAYLKEENERIKLEKQTKRR